MKKQMIPCLYLQYEKAVTGFGQRNLFGDGDVEALGRFYGDKGADGLLIFDFSSEEQEHERAIKKIGDICRAVEIPVMTAGNIKCMDDIKKLIYAGCAKVVLNFSKESNILLLEEASRRFGKEKMVISISSFHEFTDNQELIEKYSDGILALDSLQDEVAAVSQISVLLHTDEGKEEELIALLKGKYVSGLSGAYKCPIRRKRNMKNKMVRALVLGLTMSTIMMTGSVATFAEEAEVTEETAETEGAEEEGETADADKEAADNAAALIDKIYVQERTETTDEDCKAAKEAWDALTDEQKALVEGEEASPDYFGLDTGDASKDDPRNADEIGENELLVVSFGTSYNDSRVADIKGIEDALQEAYPDWSVRRAFTAQIIINHVQARDGEVIDNMQQALDRAVENGVKNLVVQPTHLMHGAEYDEMMEVLDSYNDKFESISVAEPMLGEVGDDATVINEDKAAVAEAIANAAVKDAGYETMDAAAEDGTAFVFMGHGTSHTAKVTYSQMQTQMNELGYKNVFIGTVEGEPEETACEAVIEAVKEAGYKKVVLRPLMVVAGDHAENDMAGAEEDSWKSMFEASGAFESVDTQITGLGSLPEVQQLFVEHTKAAMEK